eukprot:364360-Chlamydomonas_euryale.AAC.1
MGPSADRRAPGLAPRCLVAASAAPGWVGRGPTDPREPLSTVPGGRAAALAPSGDSAARLCCS